MIGRSRRPRADSAAMVFKLCSLLLQYPDAELLAGAAELQRAVRALPASAVRTSLARFCAWWTAQDPIELEQHYVETFDLDKRCGLYLTFYGEGDRRERGAALVRLKRLYRAAGLPLEAAELPDFLPVMLEFAADAPDGQGTIALSEHRAALELLRQSLRDRGTHYADVLDAVCNAVGEPSAADRLRAATLAAVGPPTERVGLEPFGPPPVNPVGARQ
jgi:nitrate reductase delta subunit